MKKIPSPNFNDRKDGQKPLYIIIHYTGRPTAQEAIAMLCDPQREVSAHYFIDSDGTTTQLVANEKRAWHAGVSFWRGNTDINSVSIGIELANPGHEFGYTPFPTAQLDALKILLRDIRQQYNLPPGSVWGHSDIAPLRKQDPGELFPWKEFADEGIGIWPDDGAQTNKSPADLSVLLEAIGYDCRTDEAAQASITAFLRHFHPERLQSGPDAETLRRAASLATKI